MHRLISYRKYFLPGCATTMKLMLPVRMAQPDGRRTLVRSVRYSAFFSRKDAKSIRTQSSVQLCRFAPLPLCVKFFLLYSMSVSLGTDSFSQSVTKSWHHNN